ncbi:Asp23/Gls24 family envelope stress response protein [Streptomyces sp. NPDC091279]|uniref:Asp23/Gls24 family envelope stress response protein n=1 Tax=Streptomyces sp. NPDC091279 TaxID=3365983 RepID=UPI0037FF4699
MTAHTDPPDRTLDDDEQLACGRLLSQVWDSWEQQTDDPHLRSCLHCRQAADELEGLESVVRGLPEETTDTYTDELTSLTRRVMDVVRLELRPGRPLPLGEPTEDLWIMEAVAARALRSAAESVPGVRAGSCRLVPHTVEDRSSTGSDPAATGADHTSTGGDFTDIGPVDVRLEVHAPSDAYLPDLAEQVRLRVLEAAGHELGMDIAAVDIRVTDLVDPPADSQEGRTR